MEVDEVGRGFRKRFMGVIKGLGVRGWLYGRGMILFMDGKIGVFLFFFGKLGYLGKIDVMFLDYSKKDLSFFYNCVKSLIRIFFLLNDGNLGGENYS